tara:strand:+ start:182 stop:589 length:408 start_codon:yes stop_codon:yes gene_type:complete
MIPAFYLDGINAELLELWWRVPLGLVLTLSIPLLFDLAFQRHHEYDIPAERYKAHLAQQHPKVGRPFPVHLFRLCFVAVCLRFSWIYFANLSGSLDRISHLEALAWMAYVGVVFPIWTWHEKELLCMRRDSHKNP